MKRENQYINMVRKRQFNRLLKRTSKTAFMHFLLLGFSFIFMIPLFWSMSTSLKSLDQVFAISQSWIPDPVMWNNYIRLFQEAPFFRFIGNSVLLVVLNVLGQVVSVSMVAFGFGRLRFPGKKFLFVLMLSTLMIPYYVTLIPTFVLYNYFGWINTYIPLVLPAFTGSSYLIFLVRQFVMTIPLELDDAARIDGCSTFKLYANIITPLLVPALTLVVVFTVVGTWNDFFGPLIYLNDTKMYPLSLGLVLLQGQRETDWPLLMAATLISVLPLLIIYFFAQKKLIGGIASVGLKG